MGVVITMIGSILGYHFITRARQEKDILADKFLDVGRHTSSIMHDFKGLLSTPLTYVDLLKKCMQAGTVGAEEKQALDFLAQDLTFLNLYVNEIN
jgi:hypothetical protein